MLEPATKAGCLKPPHVIPLSIPVSDSIKPHPQRLGMKTIVSRTCHQIFPHDTNESASLPLAEFRETTAYVLLGDPGSGKTTSFEGEAEECGDRAVFVPANELIAFSPKDHPEWHGKTLFVDGLDEVRARNVDPLTPFEAIQRRLAELGKPAFRISCRPADWLGVFDSSALGSVSGDGKVATLYLEPLRMPDVERILDEHPKVKDGHAFVEKAQDRGMAGLLTNPQILELLVESVAEGGSWPNSLAATLESACLQMAKEHNSAHLIVKGSLPADEALDAAGRLCVIQLISGFSSFASNPLSTNDGNVDPARCGHRDLEAAYNVLGTKLFAMEGEGTLKPIHRVVAEYLGARHLAKLVDDGLPAKRLIALMVGEDGKVVTELRGLAAWLAASCRFSRNQLIDLDPIGVGSYGDIAGFSDEDKRNLLRSLAREFGRLGSYVAAKRFVPLIETSMTRAIKDVLTDPDRSDEHQLLVDFLLRVAVEKSGLTDAADEIFEIILDDTRPSHVRRSAVEAFAMSVTDFEDRGANLQGLLGRFDSGSINDPDNEILGELLTQAYPDDLQPADVWNYLYEKGDRSYIGSYLVFWKKLVETTPDDKLPGLLNGLIRGFQRVRPALEHHGLDELPFGILARALPAHGDGTDAKQLYNWLSIGAVFRTARRVHSYRGDIRRWLTQRPEVQKELIVEGLSRCADSDNFRVDSFYVFARLFDAKLPQDFGLWCLEQSVLNADANPQVAEFFLQRAVSELRSRQHDAGLSEDVIKGALAEHGTLNAKLDGFLAPRSDPWAQQTAEEEKRLCEDQRRRNAGWLSFVRSNARALEDNEAPHGLLFKLADVYYGGVDRLDTGHGLERIQASLDGDIGLVASAVQGLTGAIRRSDIPDINAVLELRRKSQLYPVSFAILAGLAELERSHPEEIDRFDENQLSTAVIHFIHAGNGNQSPDWYRRILKKHPRVVADIRTRFAMSDFGDVKGTIDSFWDLAHDEDHAEIARNVSLRLLRDFPTRCSEALIAPLENLLLAALRHADRDSFERLIEEKISSPSVEDAQKARWIAIGLITSPDSFLTLAERYTDGSKQRVLGLAALFQKRLPVESDMKATGLVIRLVASHISPDQLQEDGWATPEMKAADLVYGLVQRLANSPTSSAGNELDELIADPALSEWEKILTRSRENQRVIRRDVSYRHPTIEEVRDTLDGSMPANPPDLAALLTDHIEEIADHIVSSNTDDWRQYWNEGLRGKPASPKIEDHCRDALLSDLRYRLPRNLDAQPEGQYALDKRSDIRVARGSDFHIPIEIKKNGHDDLWTAIHDQLIPNYTSDPETGGYGIYLVFWFGPERTTKDADGNRPTNAADVKRRLQSTLTVEESRKISICVVDVDPADSNIEGDVDSS